MAAKDTRGQAEDKQGKVLAELLAWRHAYPDATLCEIERETMRRMAELQACILEVLADEFPPAEKESLSKAPPCPECGGKMQKRGEVERQLQGPGAQNIHLTRAYWVCLACGAGFFPPG